MTKSSCANPARRAGVLASLALMWAAGAAVYGQSLPKPAVEGVKNFTRVSETVASGGATSPSAMPALAAMGYKTVINLRRPSEKDAEIDASRAAAEAAGIRYVNLPFDGKNPEAATVDAFLRVVADASREPVFLHCSSGNRAGALWLVKRMVSDGWAVESAVAEARAMGLTDAMLEGYARGYAEGRLR